MISPLTVLALGLGIVIIGIAIFRANAFLVLVIAAMAISLLAGGTDRIGRVADALGQMTAKVGIVIAMAALTGRSMVDSGSARRIVEVLAGIVGPGRVAIALMAGGFILAIPVFFDTVFYLLLPLAQVAYLTSGGNYLLLVLSIGLGASLTHSLVPPTPGPVAVAASLAVDLGTMILVGLAVSIPTAIIGYLWISLLSRRLDLQIQGGGLLGQCSQITEVKMPPFIAAILPIMLPIVLITGGQLFRCHDIGNPNAAMTFSAVCSMAIWWIYNRPSWVSMAKATEDAVVTAAPIILITAAGGAFGQMLKVADVGSAINKLIGPGSVGHMSRLGLLIGGFVLASIIKVAQGSSTVSAITAASMLGSAVRPHDGLHPVWLACAIGFGAQCGNWMNDSGFWLFSRMTGLDEIQTLQTWTVTVSLVSVVGLAVVIAMSYLVPVV